MPKKTIEQVDVNARRVLMRADFNVPLDDEGRITDDRRISLALPSIRSVIDRGGRLVLMSHLGRPAGEGYEEKFSLRPAAERLGELLDGVKVDLGGRDPVDEESGKAVESMQDGEIVLLENLRFNPGEKKGDPAFAAKLAACGEIYCNEAFGTAHRNDASMFAVPRAMEGRPRVAGFLLNKELQFLGETLANPQRPFVAIMGGAKVSDKLGALHNLKNKVDTILIGGAMAYTLLAALDHSVGSSLVESEMRSDAKKIIDEIAACRTNLILPRDHVCGREVSEATSTMVTKDVEIPEGWRGLDIGPATREHYSSVIRKAKTVVWNGPMGVFELKPFAVGTHQVAGAMVKATEAGATTVVGGGDSAAAVEHFGVADRVSHVSTGGGASLQMLEGKAFDSVELLDEA